MEEVGNCNTQTLFSLTTQTSLLREIQSGSESAWHEFYSRYAAMIGKIGEKRHLTPEECDDLMIDVMVIFWKKVDAYLADPHRGRFRKYLTKLASAAAVKIFSKNRPAEPLPPEDPDYPPDVDTFYMDEWRNFILKQALEDLKSNVDSDTYNVFYMSVVQNRPVEDIARVTRKTINNIYVIRSRCLQKIKQRIAFYRQREDSELPLHSHKNIQPV